MILGFGVWLHHMFATGLPNTALSFFSAASMVIAIPSAVAVFAWLATIATGRLVVRTPFLFFAGFIVLFVIGGVSGFMTGSVPVDWQLTDTYFVVAHIHYVLIGINVFPVIGGIYFWFPKMTGRMLDERLGRWNFWTLFIGFNLGFFPMHITGLMGMPRRIYTYPAGVGWDTLNLITTVGSFLFAAGILLLIINIVVSLRRGRVAGPNPWDAPTLEWSVPSPPPPYNFAVIPIIASRAPLWEDRLQEQEDRSSLNTGLVLDHGREALATTALDAEPDVILKMPEDTPLPLLLALALVVMLAGLLAHVWWLSASRCGQPRTYQLRGCGRACRSVRSRRLVMDERVMDRRRASGRQYRPQQQWLVGHALRHPHRGCALSLPALCILLPGHSATCRMATRRAPQHATRAPQHVCTHREQCCRLVGRARGKAGQQHPALHRRGAVSYPRSNLRRRATLEWHNKPFSLSSSTYSSLYFTITGFHMAHVAVGLLMLGALLLWSALGMFDRWRHAPISIGAIYWHFVDAVWIAVFLTFYATPYLGLGHG